MKPYHLLHPHLALMAFVPRIRLSRPPPVDNTEHIRYETGEVVEPARSILCFDCQLPIPAGKGVQVRRYLRSDIPRQTAAIVHAQCGRLGVQAG
jgi:hypothetical protein